MNNRKDQLKKFSAMDCKAIPSDPIHAKQLFILIGLLSFCFCLNTIGLDWGCSGYVPWQPDSIEGIVILSQTPKTFSVWTHKYPRGQFLINEIVYYPLKQHWEKNPVSFQTPDNKYVQAVITGPRLKTLAIVTHWITLLMTVGTILSVYLTTLALFNDHIAAFLAGLALTVSHTFCFFASTGNIDVPSIFWFSWATWAAIRAVQTNKLRYFLVLGFCMAYSVGTKDGQATYFAGLFVGTVALYIQQVRQQGRITKTALLSFPFLKLLAAAAIALVVFLFLNGFFWNGTGEFTARVQHWKGVIHDFLQISPGQWGLLKASCWWMYWGLGWPMLTAVVISLFYLAWREPVKLLFLMAPLISFYILTIMQIQFVAERFLLGGFTGLAIAAGKMFSDGIQWKSKYRYIIMFLGGGVFLFSAMYCLGLRLELRSDTRQRTEQWFYANVSRNKTIGAVMSRNYAPRMQYEGYVQYNDWVSTGIKTAKGTQKVMPDYLLLSTSWPCQGQPQDAAFRNDVFANKTAYEKVARFDPVYLKPGRSILGLAGWPYDKHDFISPSMYIYQKKNIDSN